MKKDDIKIIQAIIDFSEADLISMALEEKRILANQTASLLRLPAGFLIADFADMQKNRSQKLLSEFQSDWKQLISWIVDNFNRNWQIEFGIKYILTWSDSAEGTVSAHPSAISSGNHQKTEAKAYDMSFCGKPYSKYTEIPMINIELPEGAFIFVKAIDGCPKKSLTRCLHCKKIFFNPTKRRKKYCSQQCQTTAGMRRVRERRKKTS